MIKLKAEGENPLLFLSTSRSCKTTSLYRVLTKQPPQNAHLQAKSTNYLATLCTMIYGAKAPSPFISK